jgi:DNA polymerase III epsilon subunit family exonuclease
MSEITPVSELETYIVLDLETTGLDHRSERILEIGAVKVVEGEIAETFSQLVKPDVPIRKSSFHVHNISDEMIEDAPSIEEVLPKLLAFMGDLPFVAHNAIFDYSFVNEACKRLYGTRLLNQRIDTYEIYKVVFPGEHSHGLSSLLTKFGFDSHVSHRALEDAECLAKVYPKIMQLYQQQLAWQFSQLPNINYLTERFLRLQKTVQLLQSEMNDLKEVFKLHFNQGGRSIPIGGDMVMTTQYRRTYEYNEETIREIIATAGLERQATKINMRAIDRLIDRGGVDPEVKQSLKESRIQMTETRVVNFMKAEEYHAEKVLRAARIEKQQQGKQASGAPEDDDVESALEE